MVLVILYKYHLVSVVRIIQQARKFANPDCQENHRQIQCILCAILLHGPLHQPDLARLSPITLRESRAGSDNLAGLNCQTTHSGAQRKNEPPTSTLAWLDMCVMPGYARGSVEGISMHRADTVSVCMVLLCTFVPFVLCNICNRPVQRMMGGNRYVVQWFQVHNRSIRRSHDD